MPTPLPPLYLDNPAHIAHVKGNDAREDVNIAGARGAVLLFFASSIGITASVTFAGAYEQIPSPPSMR